MNDPHAPLMKRGLTAFLQVVIVLFGVAVLAFLLWEPHVEGRNAHATIYEMYFHDPFLAYMYATSIPFFMGVYRALQLLGRVGWNEVFSQSSVRAMRTIKYCALAIIGFVALGLIFYILPFGDPDDRPAGVFMCILITFPSTVAATAAAMFERILQNAVDLKSENDLTV